MIKTIKCTTCEEILGTLEKPEITDQDISEYQVMVSCSLGHQTITLIDQEG